jgi:hypothetical protein
MALWRRPEPLDDRETAATLIDDIVAWIGL